MGRDFDRQSTISAVSAEQIKNDYYESSEVYAVGAYESFTVYAAAGTVAKIVTAMFMCNKIPGAAAGTQRIVISIGNLLLTSGTSGYMNDVYYDAGSWLTADNEQLPAEKSLQLLALRDAVFDDQVPLYVFFYNNADRPTDPAANRFFRLLYRERQVV